MSWARIDEKRQHSAIRWLLHGDPTAKAKGLQLACANDQGSVLNTVSLSVFLIAGSKWQQSRYLRKMIKNASRSATVSAGDGIRK